MIERLQYVRLEPDRVLDAGSGSGRGLAALRRRYPRAALFAMDSAQAVLSAARSREPLFRRAMQWIAGGRTQAVCGDFTAIPFAGGTFQFVWSNLALAWAADPLAAFREMHRVLAPGGLLMFASYGPDTLKELRQAFAAVDDFPHTLSFPDMHDLGDMLGAAGFTQPVMDMEVLKVTYPDFGSIVSDLRSSGQLNASLGRRRGLLGRRAYRMLCQAYEGLREGGKLPVTVEVVYGHAWRGTPRATQEGHAVINTEGLLRRPNSPRR